MVWEFIFVYWEKYVVLSGQLVFLIESSMNKIGKAPYAADCNFNYLVLDGQMLVMKEGVFLFVCCVCHVYDMIMPACLLVGCMGICLNDVHSLSCCGIAGWRLYRTAIRCLGDRVLPWVPAEIGMESCGCIGLPPEHGAFMLCLENVKDQATYYRGM